MKKKFTFWIQPVESAVLDVCLLPPSVKSSQEIFHSWCEFISGSLWPKTWFRRTCLREPTINNRYKFLLETLFVLILYYYKQLDAVSKNGLQQQTIISVPIKGREIYCPHSLKWGEIVYFKPWQTANLFVVGINLNGGYRLSN